MWRALLVVALSAHAAFALPATARPSSSRSRAARRRSTASSTTPCGRPRASSPTSSRSPRTSAPSRPTRSRSRSRSTARRSTSRARMWSDGPADIDDALTERDVTDQAERFIVSIDPSHTRRIAYSFAVTAARRARRLDPRRRQEGNRDPSWDPVWIAQHRDPRRRLVRRDGDSAVPGPAAEHAREELGHQLRLVPPAPQRGRVLARGAEGQVGVGELLRRAHRAAADPSARLARAAAVRRGARRPSTKSAGAAAPSRRSPGSRPGSTRSCGPCPAS